MLTGSFIYIYIFSFSHFLLPQKVWRWRGLKIAEAENERDTNCCIVVFSSLTHLKTRRNSFAMDRLNNSRGSRQGRAKEGKRRAGAAVWRETSNDLLKAIDSLVAAQWAPIAPQLTQEAVEHIEKFRESVPRLVSTSQLYSVMGNASAVDQQLHQLCHEGHLRMIETNMAKPNVLVIRMEDYLAFVDAPGSTFCKFAEYVKKHDFTTILRSELESSFSDEEITMLMTKGYLTLIPSDMDSLRLSVPNSGFTLKLLQTSQTYITRILRSKKSKELSIDELNDRWTKSKAMFKDFKGLNLQWCLHFLIGEGIVECFETRDSVEVIKLF